MTKKRIDTGFHYAQYLLARFSLVVVIGFLTYSIWTQKIGAIIFCSLFVIYVLILMNRTFNKPNEIEFDENYIYLENGNKRIELNKIIGIKRNRILYEENGIESKIKLPNFHFMDKKWTELRKLIKTKSTKHNNVYNSLFSLCVLGKFLRNFPLVWFLFANLVLANTT